MRLGFFIAAALLLVAFTACPSSAQNRPSTQPSSPQEMQRRILALQAKIDELKSQSDQQQNQDAVQHVLDDSQRQSQLLSIAPFPTGYDPNVGFVLQSPDGNFSLHPGLLMQFRGVVNDRNRITPGHGGVTGEQGDNTETGFEMTRFRLTLDGNAISPLLTYYIQFAQDAQNAASGLLDAYAMYRVSSQSPLAIKLGQFKDPVWHEENLLPSMQMAVDRSLVNALVGGLQTNRIQGAAIVYDEDRLRGQLALDNGYNSGDEPFYGPSGIGSAVGAGAGLAPTNWGSSGRAEYLLVGDRTPLFNPFSEYDQFTSRGDRQDILVLGTGFDYSESGANKILFHTADVQYNIANRWALYAAYLGAYRNLYTNRGVAPGSYYDSGYLLQAGYLLDRNIEPFARVDYTHLDGAAEPGILQDNLYELTAGVNYYLLGQRAKVTLDASWLPNGSPLDVNYLDILQNNAHNEYLLRCQFQLAL
jgi:hypothetical protein